MTSTFQKHHSACSLHTLAGRQRSLSGDPITPSCRRKRTPKDWSYKALNRYFGGSLTEAASHLANNVCNSYLDPARNNPLSPLPRLSRRQHRLQTDTNPYFLDSPIKMVENRCSRCHRYKKDAPSADLGHDGSQAESKCKLEHHPFPCDFIDVDGNVCEIHADEGPADKGAPDYNDLAKEFEGKFNAQSTELDQLRSCMLEMKKMVSSMRLTANPKDSLATSTAQSTGSTATTSTASITSPQVSLLSPPQTGLGSVGTRSASGAPGSLTSEAQSLLHLNDRSGVTGAGLQGYSGPNMRDLQQDKSIADEVQRQLAVLIASTPALQKVVAGQPPAPTPKSKPSNQTQPQFIPNPSAAYALPAHEQPGQGAQHTAYQAIHAGALGGGPDQARSDINLLDMDSLLGLTVRDKQYRPHEFASRGNFFYAKNINDRNITLPLYVYGYLKHCIILMSGLVPVADGEVMARLVNLMHVMEITSNNSTLNDFEHTAWQLGRGYGDRVFNDIQQGLRTWPDMPNNILPDVFLHVKDMVDMQSRKNNATRGRGGAAKGRGSGKERSGSDRPAGDKPMVCSTYNDFFTGSGCAYEHNNQRKCSYEHYCSKCFSNSGSKVVHKARFCTVVASSGTPVPTTSG